MKDVSKLTPNEIRSICYSAIIKEVGVTGLLKFNRQFSIGEGDYTEDRRESLKDYTIDDIVNDIKKNK
jgi:hypothetical protein